MSVPSLSPKRSAVSPAKQRSFSDRVFFGSGGVVLLDIEENCGPRRVPRGKKSYSTFMKSGGSTNSQAASEAVVMAIFFEGRHSSLLAHGTMHSGRSSAREVNSGGQADTLKPAPIGHFIEFSLRAGFQWAGITGDGQQSRRAEAHPCRGGFRRRTSPEDTATPARASTAIIPSALRVRMSLGVKGQCVVHDLDEKVNAE